MKEDDKQSNPCQMCGNTIFWREQLFTKTSGGEVCQMRCTKCGSTHTIETGGNMTGIKYSTPHNSPLTIKLT